MTGVAHIAVQLWQTDDAPTYVLSVDRSLAGSFWDWLAASGAEHGLELATASVAVQAPSLRDSTRFDPKSAVQETSGNR
jgi:sarcosine oxidase subunit gamma